MSKRIAKSLDEVAAATGLSRRQLVRLRHKGMPGQTGAYDLDAIEAWRKENVQRNSDEVQDPGGPDSPKYWRKEKDRYATLNLAIDIQRKRGSLFTKEAVRSLFLDRVRYLREGMLALPRMVAVEFPDVDGLEAYVEQHVRDVLDAYSKDNVVELLEQWRRQDDAGVRIVRSRGRPKGS